MDPDDVFNRFNEIIGPDFSLIEGRRVNEPHAHCDSEGVIKDAVGCEKSSADTTSKIVAQSGSYESRKDSGTDDLESQKLLFHRKVTRNTHGTLFRPKELVYIKRNTVSRTGVGKEECVLVINLEERATGNNDDDRTTHILRYVRAFHDGHHVSVTKHSIEVGSSSQEIVNLTAEDLGVIPMRLLPPAERQDIQARLISRGKKYRRICERPNIPMRYEGQVIPLGQRTDWTWTTNQSVMVDGMAAQEMRVGHANNSLTASDPGQGLETFLGSEGHSMPDGGDSASSQGRVLMNDDAMHNAKDKQKSSECEEPKENHEWTDMDYLTCPPTLAAFLLDENVWANVHVEYLTNIVWPENPFDSLELEAGKKRLIQSLTRRFKTKETSHGSHQDTGGDKGGNLIIFLTGPPGVGTTLTAEVVAEEAHRPLYRVSTGELSVDPSALKKQLGDIFILGRRWGAIVLIDEADMFMTKRRASTPGINAAVTAFLRLFHTYDGLLFLTSTSKDIDTAFYDRIHATIEYTELDETQRTNIWRRQLQRAPEGHPPNSPWPEEAYRLLGKVETNGREIRNIVRTAEQLAMGLSTELAMEHVAAAMRNFGGSDNDIESICEKLEMLEEKVGGGRGPACDDDVELQH